MTVQPSARAERLHFVERQRLGPGDALDRAERTLECGDRIVGQRDRYRELARDLAAFARELGRDRGIGEDAGDLSPCFLAGGEEFLQAGLGRLEQAFEHAAAIALEPCLGKLGARLRLLRRVGQRKQHLHEREPVRVAVMDARDQHAAAAVVLDDMKLPERVRMIERRRGQLADEGLELGLVRRARQRRDAHVPVDVEILVGFPPRAARRTAPRADGIDGTRETARTRSVLMRFGSSGPANISTPVIIIRLVGRSMRSHAVSTLDIGSRCR